MDVGAIHNLVSFHLLVLWGAFHLAAITIQKHRKRLVARLHLVHSFARLSLLHHLRCRINELAAQHIQLAPILNVVRVRMLNLAAANRLRIVYVKYFEVRLDIISVEL